MEKRTISSFGNSKKTKTQQIIEEISSYIREGELGPGEKLPSEKELRDEKKYRSIIDTEFSGEAVEEQTVDGRRTVVPKVTGSSYITGLNYFLTSQGDPLKDGFTL